MKYDEFIKTTEKTAPPEGMPDLLLALWRDRNGEWDEAHRIAQGISTEAGSAVHAYLHRVEGDIGNARHWYSRAGRTEFSGALDEEWEALAREFTA